MTGYTFCGKRCETQRSMTLLALQFNMCPRQRKACLGMIESGRQPGVGSVAGCAARAKLTLVSIIRFMTGVTISGKCCEAWGGMALCAGQVAVGTCEGKIGIGMVKSSRQPASSGVTGFATRTESSLVSIVPGMAGVTILRC